MSSNSPYRETDAQRLTFAILENQGFFDCVDVDNWNALQEKLQSIEELNLFGNLKVSDIRIVGEMTSLKRLYFGNTAVADISWARSLVDLEIIRFNATPVSGFGSLAGLRKLKEIRANGCSKVTPEDIEAIFNLPKRSLKELHLRRTSNSLDSVLRRMRDKHYGRVRIEYEWVKRS